MNIENIIFWVVLIAGIITVVSWFLRDFIGIGISDVARTVLRIVWCIAWGAVFAWVLGHFGFIPGLIGFIVGAILAGTGLIGRFFRWLFGLILSGLKALWKMIPTVAKVILIIALVAAVIGIVIAVF